MEESWDQDAAQRFADFLVAEREKVRLSQRQLAELSGVSHTTVARLESGKEGSRGKLVRPNPDTLLGVSLGLSKDGSGQIRAALARGYYRELMRIAGYGWILFDPHDLITLRASDPSAAFTEEIARSNEALAIVENLQAAIQGGAVIGRMLDTVIQITGALLNQVDPDERFRVVSASDSPSASWQFRVSLTRNQPKADENDGESPGLDTQPDE